MVECKEVPGVNHEIETASPGIGVQQYRSSWSSTSRSKYVVHVCQDVTPYRQIRVGETLSRSAVSEFTKSNSVDRRAFGR